MRNLGPKSVDMLAAIDVFTVDDLKEKGSVETYRMLKNVFPTVSLNMLWALEGAVLDEHWQTVAKMHRSRLLQELGNLK